MRAAGQRLRLYARALVLEDPAGDRLALVVADLPLGSALLHRRISELLPASDGIGIDRLMIAATHTHAGPGHYFEGGVYNAEGSAVPGFDPVMVDSLATRIATAIHAALLDMKEARLAWGSRRIWGYTRIRSLPAMLRNTPVPMADSDAPSGLPLEYQLVDPELVMLRVDQRTTPTGEFRPAGAFSVFAMHGTGNATGNDLLDGDIHGIVERRLERHIDQDLNHTPDLPFIPHAFHLFANGTEGDVSPAWPPQARCNTPTLSKVTMLEGPFEPTIWQWKPPTDGHLAACVHAARQAVEWIGTAVGAEAIALFDELNGKTLPGLPIARAFITLALRRDALALGICPVPAVGMSALVGADDAHTRMNGWHLAGVIPVGLEQSAASPNDAVRGCQAQKHQLLDVIVGDAFNRATVTDQLPSFGQISVFQIGDRLIGTVPGEVTTTAGKRIRAEMLDSAKAHGIMVAHASIVGLTNGYLEYITTAEEYTAQYYEGGSTLYGPGEAAMFGRELANLAGKVSHGDVLDPAVASAMTAQPGKPARVLHQVPTPGRVRPKSIGTLRCTGDTLYATLSMGTVNDWAVTGASDEGHPRVTVLRDGVAVASDDDPALELRLRSRRADPARWDLRLAGARPGSYQVSLHQGPTSTTVRCGTS